GGDLDQFAQDVAATLRLADERPEVRLQGRAGRGFAGQLGKQGADGRQRRIQLVCGACRLRGDGEDAFVEQGTHALVFYFRLLRTQGARQSGNEEAEHARSDGEADRHAGQVQVEEQAVAAGIADFRQDNG